MNDGVNSSEKIQHPRIDEWNATEDELSYDKKNEQIEWSAVLSTCPMLVVDKRESLVPGTPEILAHFRAENPFARDEEFQRDFIRQVGKINGIGQDNAFSRMISHNEKIKEAKDSGNREELLYALWMAHELFPEEIVFGMRLALEISKREYDGFEKYKRLAVSLALSAVRKHPTEREIMNLAMIAKRFDDPEIQLIAGDLMLLQFTTLKEPSTALMVKVEALAKMERYEEVLSTLDQFKDRCVPDQALGAMHAIALMELGRTEEASRVMDAALAQDASDERALLVALRVAIASKNFDVALRTFTTLAQSATGKPHVMKRKYLRPIASLAAYEGRYDAGIRLLSLIPRNDWTVREYTIQAKLYIGKSEYSMAQTFLAGAMKLEKESEQTLWLYAKTYALKGEIGRAKKILEKLLDIQFRFNYAAAYLYIIENSPEVSDEEKKRTQFFSKLLDAQDVRDGKKVGERYKALRELVRSFNWRDVEQDSDDDILISKETLNPFYDGLHTRPVERTRGNTHRPTSYGRPGKK